MSSQLTPEPDPVRLHITETHQDWRFGGEWIAYCRCGWAGSYLPTQQESRADGEQHLAEGNGREATTP